MGRLPTHFANRQIMFRVPYAMPAELSLTTGQVGIQFPDASFLHNVDKPFEVHRMVGRVTGFDGSGVMLDPPPLSLERRIRLSIADTAKNEKVTKAAQEFATIFNKETGSWEWADPYYLTRSEGFQVTADAQAFTSTGWGITIVPTITTIRVEVAFQGFLVVVGAPTDQR